MIQGFLRVHTTSARVSHARTLEADTVYDIPTYNINIKAIQISFDEELLERLDESDEVKREGRSAVLRRALREYLERRRRRAVAEQYRRAYGKKGGLGYEYEGWEDELEWPPS